MGDVQDPSRFTCIGQLHLLHPEPLSIRNYLVRPEPWFSDSQPYPPTASGDQLAPASRNPGIPNPHPSVDRRGGSSSRNLRNVRTHTNPTRRHHYDPTHPTKRITTIPPSSSAPQSANWCCRHQRHVEFRGRDGGRPMTETALLLEGVAPDRITTAFLTDLMKLADDHELCMHSLSVLDPAEPDHN